MKDAWTPVIAAAVVAIVSLAGALYLRPSKEVRRSAAHGYEVGRRWNQVAAILVGVATAIAAERVVHLDWYLAIPVGVIAFGIIRFPAYINCYKRVKSDQNRPEISS